MESSDCYFCGTQDGRQDEYLKPVFDDSGSNPGAWVSVFVCRRKSCIWKATNKVDNHRWRLIMSPELRQSLDALPDDES